jgi:L-fucose mutarotase
MLKGLSPILSPELLQVLRSMGHGDEIVVVDANFPADSMAQRLVRLDGLPVTAVTDAILSVMPLDDFVPEAAWRMEVVGDPTPSSRSLPSFASFWRDTRGTASSSRRSNASPSTSARKSLRHRGHRRDEALRQHHPEEGRGAAGLRAAGRKSGDGAQSPAISKCERSRPL